MKEDYSDFIAMAQEMIDEFGREIRVTKMGGSQAVDFLTGKPLSNGKDVTTNAVFVGSVGGYGAIITSDDLFQKSQQIALVAVPSDKTDLSDCDQIIDDGETWTIKILKAIRPANDTLMYYMGVSQ